MLLRKDVCSYEYVDSLERFDETSLPDKEAFYSKRNMEDITDADYRHANNVFKEFELKNLGEYHDNGAWISMASMFKENGCKIRITNRS